MDRGIVFLVKVAEFQRAGGNGFSMLSWEQ